MKHPAVFNDAVLNLVSRAVPSGSLCLDPFAGTCKIERIALDFDVVCVELEFEWAARGQRGLVGNALHLPFKSKTFDAIITSPCYGNRMADHHDARDASSRRSYTHDLREATGNPNRRLHPDNGGAMQWGPKYRQLHLSAWLDVVRTLRPLGLMLLNLKDHYRNRVLQPVTAWHLAVLRDYGMQLLEGLTVPTPGNRHGENRHRIPHEYVIQLQKVG